MAKLKKKLLEPSKEDQLRIIADQYFPENLRARFLEAVASSGTIPEELLSFFNESDKSSVLDMVQSITGGKPTRQDFTKSELQTQLLDEKSRPIDEASLTDEELGKRLDIYETLQTATDKVDRATIEREIDSKFKGYGIEKYNKPQKDALKKYLVDFVTQNQRMPNAQEFASELSAGKFADTFGRDFTNSPEVENFLNDQDVRNSIIGKVEEFTKPTEGADEDVKRIEDILATRKTAAQRETDISGFIEGLPGELAQGTNARASLLRELGSREFERITPQLLARENAMGRLSSGSAGDVLAGAYGDITGNIESEIAGLKSADEEFYYNAAYQNQVRKLLEGRTDLGAGIEFERQNVRGQQEQRFQKGEFLKNMSLENDLLMQKYETQIQAAQSARQRQQALSERGRRFGLETGLSSLGGTLVGAGAGFAVGGPIGAAVGAGIGGGVGSGLPLLFGRQR